MPGCGDPQGRATPVSIRTDSNREGTVEKNQTDKETTEPPRESRSGNGTDETGTRDGYRTEYAGTAAPEGDTIDKKDAPQTNVDIEEVVPGEDFRKWVETGINDSTLVVNNKSALVHIGRTNIFLVAPGIFERYAVETSMDWETEQRHFLSLEIHTRNAEKDWWYARVQTAGKMARIRGVLVPSEHFELKPELPVKEQMAILRK